MLRGKFVLAAMMATIMVLTMGAVASASNPGDNAISNQLDANIEVMESEGNVYNVTQETWHATIGAAIDGAASGDELVAEPGTYDEVVEIDLENITLASSEGREVTIISGKVEVRADGVTLEGFTIDNGDGDSCIDTFVDDGLTIRDNLLVNSLRGVRLGGHNTGFEHRNIVVEGNEFDTQFGITQTEDTPSLKILGNTFRTTGEAVGLGEGVGFDSTDSDFSGNEFQGTGVHVEIHNDALEDAVLVDILENNAFPIAAVVTSVSTIEDVHRLGDIMNLSWSRDVEYEPLIASDGEWTEETLEIEVPRDRAVDVTIRARLGENVDGANGGGSFDVMAVNRVLYALYVYDNGGNLVEDSVFDVDPGLGDWDSGAWRFGPSGGFTFAHSELFDGGAGFEDGTAETTFEVTFNETGSFTTSVYAVRLEDE